MRAICKVLTYALCIATLSFSVLAQAPTTSKTTPKKAEARYTPFDAVQIALTDAITVAALNDISLNLHYIRYLSLHNIPEAERKETKMLIDFVLNSLNTRYRGIKKAATLPAGSADPLVVRVNLFDYGIDPVAWDNLAETGSGPVPIPDPYFHAVLVKEIKPHIIAKESIVYVPYVTYDYARVKGNQGQITVDLPHESNLYVEEKLVASGTVTRLFKTPELERNKEYKYKLKAEITIDGKQTIVEKEVPIWGGWETKVNIVLTKTLTKVEEVPLVLPKTKKVKFLASAPWLALEKDEKLVGTTIAKLIEFTNTKNPILRADWFAVYATWAPAYYNLIGLQLKDNPDKDEVKKKPQVFLEKDFENLFKFRFNDAIDDIVAGITDTKIVTLHNRVIQRFSTVVGITGGYYWRSQDTDKGIDDEDYLNQIAVFDKVKIKAQEIIASGRNGLNFYALTNDKGVLLDVAVSSIAIHGEDMPTKLTDKQVFAGRNCMLCHAGGQLFIKDKVRNIARDKIALFIADKTKNLIIAKKIEEAFSPDTKGIIELDNAKFLISVKATTDKEGKLIGKILENMVYSYYYQPVTLDKMAREAGIETKKLEELLKKGVNLDYTLTAVLQTPQEHVSRLPWERQGFPALMQFLLNFNPKK